MLHLELDLAKAAGIDARALTAGLRSIAPPGEEQSSWIDWDDFIELIERFERMAGGPEAVGRAMRAALPVAYAELRAMTAVFVRPIPFFSFVMTRMMRAMYRHMEVSEIERLGDDRVRWTQTIPEPYRASEAFHRGTVSLVEVFPRHLELPEATIEHVTMSPRTAEIVARFPPAPSLGGAVSSAINILADQLESAFATIGERIRSPEHGRPMKPVSDAAGWADRLKLSPRQREVFALLVLGKANKEIAADLGCSERNVEFHVGRILRAARVSSRAELLVKVLGPSS